MQQIRTVVANRGLTGTVDGISITTLYAQLANVLGFDFGDIIINTTSGLNYLVATVNLNFGTITAPGSFTSDFGSIV